MNTKAHKFAPELPLSPKHLDYFSSFSPVSKLLYILLPMITERTLLITGTFIFQYN